MTPAIKVASKNRIAHTVHQYSHDPAVASYGSEAADKLGVTANRVFKTLVVRLDDLGLAVAVVPVATQLHLKSLAKALGAKRAAMADRTEVERATGYVLGGVSPLGQKKRLPTVIDATARQWPTIYVSAGRRGLEIELTAEDLCRLVQGTFAAIGQTKD